MPQKSLGLDQDCDHAPPSLQSTLPSIYGLNIALERSLRDGNHDNAAARTSASHPQYHSGGSRNPEGQGDGVHAPFAKRRGRERAKRRERGMPALTPLCSATHVIPSTARNLQRKDFLPHLFNVKMHL